MTPKPTEPPHPASRKAADWYCSKPRSPERYLLGRGDPIITAFEELRAEWRRTPVIGVAQKLQKLRSQPSWQETPVEIKARVMRFSAEVALSIRKDIGTARELMQEAESFAGENRVLTAKITQKEHGAKAAADLLQSPTNIEEWNTRMAMLLEAEAVDALLEEWTHPPERVGPDAESRRLYALALMTKRRLPEAAEALMQAKKRRPDSFALRLASAILDYFTALSPAAPESVFILCSHPRAVGIGEIGRGKSRLLGTCCGGVSRAFANCERRNGLA